MESTASEVSWEAVEDTDTVRPTLWIPDHAASSCMGCSTQFWFGRRKHHCRLYQQSPASAIVRAD